MFDSFSPNANDVGLGGFYDENQNEAEETFCGEPCELEPSIFAKLPIDLFQYLLWNVRSKPGDDNLDCENYFEINLDESLGISKVCRKRIGQQTFFISLADTSKCRVNIFKHFESI